MEFTVIKNISEVSFKKVIETMAGPDFKIIYESRIIEQTYNGDPFTISIIPRDGYIRIMTSVESGWPYLHHVIDKNKYDAMRIRYFEGELAEFYLWIKGSCVRIVYALKDSKWTWFEQGDVQEWEKVEQYKNRSVKKRLTKEMLEEYLAICGYNENVT